MTERVVFEFKLDDRGDRTASRPMFMCCQPVVMGMDIDFKDPEELEVNGLKSTLDFFEQLHEDLYG
jgi:hypothetical protein